MKRIVAIVAVLVAAVVLVFLAVGGGDDDNPYQVRAIFRNAFTVIPGEDVKVAGVVVGSIGALETASNGHQAAVVLDIENKGFQDFRQDASCTIRPQSFIGERYVECTPTQPHPVGDNPSPKLREIQSGPGKGQYLLPSSNTVTPVDLDLVNNIMRLPFRERLTVLLNEFGIGLGARGKDLSKTIRAANPALRNLDKVVAILAKQNKVLADLAVNGDKALAPLAKDREQLADYFKQANTVNEATAERSADFEKDLELLPQFLAELTPTMKQLQGFSDEFTPVLQNLGAAAPSLNRLSDQLPDFNRAAVPAFKTLGDAADAGSEAFVAANPLSKDLKALGKTIAPVSVDLKDLLTSLKSTDGVDHLMDFIYYGVASVNGYDTFGHYLRTELLANLCTEYTIVWAQRCSALFDSGNKRELKRRDEAGRRSVSLPDAGTDAATQGATTDAASSGAATGTATPPESAAPSDGAIKLPDTVLPDPDRKEKPAAAAPSSSSDAAGDADPSGSLLNYLLGN